jgi:hypothetical protein
MSNIPKPRASKKYPFDKLKVNEYFVSGDFTREHMKYMGAIVSYYNRTRYEDNGNRKVFRQRAVDGKNRIYRAE